MNLCADTKISICPTPYVPAQKLKKTRFKKFSEQVRRGGHIEIFLSAHKFTKKQVFSLNYAHQSSNEFSK